MTEKLNISCPISSDKVDENVARTAAFYIIVITAISLLLSNFIIPLLLAADFALRAFTDGSYSPIKLIARRTARLLNLPQKPTDAAPKKFSAGLGMFFSLLIGLLLLFQQPIAAYSVGGILVFCAVLEGGFGICLGCIVYSSVILPFTKQQ